MDRDEALRLITLGILAAGDVSSRAAALDEAEELLDAYLRDPVYRVDGVQVPEEFVSDALANL